MQRIPRNGSTHISTAASRRRRGEDLLWLVILITSTSAFTGCVRDRVTGERRFSLVEWTPEQELELGRENAPNVEAIFEAIDPDPEANRILGELVREMVGYSVREKDFEFRFKILNSSVPNAFALPGGFVYVTRGLLQLLETEGQFISVMGHELGHVEHQHSMYNQSRGTIKGVLTAPLRLGTAITRGLPGERVVGLATGVVASPLVLSGLRFSRGQELEADKRGVYFAAEMGYDPREGTKTFEMFARLEKESGASSLMTELSWFRTYPLNEDRVRGIQQTIVEKYPAFLSKTKGDFRPDSRDFTSTLEKIKSAALTYALYDEAVALIGKEDRTPADLENAIKKLTEASEKLVEEPLFRIPLGEVAYMKENKEDARLHFSSAVEIYERHSPGDGHWKPHLYLGVLEIEAEEGEKAVSHLETARKRFPMQPAIHFFLGKAYEMTGKRGGARRAYQQVLELTPSDSELHQEARERLRTL